MGTGSVLEKGSFRLALNGVRGFQHEGGHLETKGLDDNAQIITVPLHRHEVSLDYLRMELDLEYAFGEKWGFVIRVPYDIKDQKAEVGFIEEVTAEEKQAALMNRDIHHRSESYRGLSDLMTLATHNRRDFFRDGDFLKISFGSTFPIGKTEENPYQLGDQGLRHLHIQFGTGTFDPLLEVNYRTAFARNFSLGGYALGRFPFYENHKTYRGPVEVTSGLFLGYRLNERLLFHVNGTLYYQNFAYWAGEQDINSGLVASSGMFGVTIRAWEKAALGLDVRVPFTQRTLAEGDAFEQGPTLLFRISRDL